MIFCLVNRKNLKSYQTATGYATPTGAGSTAEYFYNVKDWLGTTRATISATGTLLNGADYYPYGKKLPGRSTFNTSGEGYRYQFTGHEQDGETGYQYHGARYYNEELGRYMSVDPLAQEYMGWSPYAYVQCNPISFIDPTGMRPEDPPAGSGLPSNPTDGKVYTANNGTQYTSVNGSWGCYAGEGEVNYAQQRAAQRATGALYRSASALSKAEKEQAYSTGVWSTVQRARLNDRLNFQHGLGARGQSMFSDNAASDETKKEWAYSRANASAAGKIVVGTMAIMASAPFVIGNGIIYAPAAGQMAWAGARIAGGQAIKYGYKGLKSYHDSYGKSGGYANIVTNYITQSGSTGSMNPLDHNMVEYAGSAVVGKFNITNQCLIGASGGLVNYTPSSYTVTHLFNQDLGITLGNTLNGGTAPVYNLLGPVPGYILGNTQQTVVGRKMNELEDQLQH